MSIEKAISQTKNFKSPYQRMVVNLLYTSSWMNLKQIQLLRPYNLSVSQYNVLRILRGAYPTPVSTSYIAERMIDRTSNASRIVDRLLRKELVIKEPSAVDRRIVNILITEKGLDLLAKIDVEQDHFEARLHSLTEEKANLLSDLLDELRACFQEE
ncbi:MAG: MarR family transcriptional regulator [Thermonema sp.]|jgi:DNA-binding MarR family transcriptional regulator|uniref:MarR family winged helix-turn-helix transcriptional regulator n=1 Tax=Thermonema TaxID=28194 RepID=UPI00056DCC82|nr:MULTISPECIES: MarR family transcriptional regulator [Thermonema]GIV40328.1 MAG: MarR family transcriptional regulator [Thermonema sp.]